MNVKIFEKKIASHTVVKSPIEELIKNDLPLYKKMARLRDSLAIVKLTPNGENELMKLLFEELSGTIYFPRKGDNSERFDATINFSNYKTVVEIEIPSSAILDAPRNLLDDYAVLKTRKGESLSNIVPLVICWDLPNKRTDYWNVISDVKEILRLEIKTISTLALAVHCWTHTPINFTNSEYYLDRSHSSMENLCELLKAKGIDPNDFPGYFSPFK